MFEIGRVCIKIAGRYANRHCVVVEKIDNHFVLVDGNLKRKRCNVKHLEPLKIKIDIKKGASTEEVRTALQSHGIEVEITNPKTKKAEKPVKKRAEKTKKTGKE